MRSLVMILIFIGGSPSLLADSLPDVIDKMRSSIVGIGTVYPPRQPNVRGEFVSFYATGFVVGNGLQVITNAHVLPENTDVDNNETLAVFTGRGKNSQARSARLVIKDERTDLALLEIEGEPIPALTLGHSDTVREGMDVAFTGFPIGVILGLYPVTHTGIISAITPLARPANTAKQLTAEQLRLMRNPMTVFQMDAIAYPGNSGSPIYVPNSGVVIGVLNSVFVKKGKESMLTKPSGITYAIPAQYVITLLAEANRL